MHPQWFKLLHEQQYGRGITAHGPATGPRVGLTPSFLVGALRTPPGAVQDAASSRAELSAMLESMRDNSSGKLVHIAECPDIHQPRASLTDGAIGHLGDPVVRGDGSPSKLYAWPQYFARTSRDLESLADELWRVLGAAICDGRFSYRGGTWQKFDMHDLEFIARALRNDDDA